MENRVLLSATLVRDIGAPPDSSYPVFFLDAGDGTAYFKVLHADIGSDGVVFRTDGTAAGTTLVASQVQANSGVAAGGTAYLGLAATSGSGMQNLDLRTPAGGFTPVGIASRVISYSGGQVTVDDGYLGNEPYITDGTFSSVHILKDIHPGPYQSSNPRGFTLVGGSVSNGGIVYFSADDGTSGAELWKTDLTEAGTVRVKDINPGPGGSAPANLIDVNGTLYFTADDGVHGRELWRSDGTEAGTVMVAESLEGVDAWPLANLTAIGDALYYTSAGDTELWKAQAGGASLVKSFLGAGGVVSSTAVVNDQLLLTVNLPDNALAELWRSDGTAAGTTLLRQVPGVQGLTGAGPRAFFRATDAAAGDELWTTDGTAAGTVRVADIDPGVTGSQISAITRIGNGGVVYFSATDGGHGVEPWRSDGTASGTYMIADLAGGGVSAQQTGPQNMIAFRGSVFFNYTIANPAWSGLWRSDGTTAGTERLFDGAVTRTKFTVFDGSLYWVEADNSSAPALVRSDGTVAGTSVVRRFNLPAPYGTSIDELTVSGDHLYFTVTGDMASGDELWRTDGTPAGTAIVKDIVPGAGDSLPKALTDVNGRLFFFANTSAAGYEPWTSDGTTAGTVMLKDIFPGSGSSTLGPGSVAAAVTSAGGLFYFVARASNTTFGPQIWKSDGTPAGTVPATDLNDATLSLTFSPSSIFRNYLVPIGNSVYFLAGSVYNPGFVSLYRTDGTPATTSSVKQLGLPPNHPPFQMYNLNGAIYFFWMTQDGYDDHDLWKSDGTADGTQIIGSIPLDTASGKAIPDPLFTVGGKIYFAGTVGTGSNPITRLYQSTGLPGGMSVAEPALSLIDGGFGYPPDAIVAVGDTLYFRASDHLSGNELWKLPPAVLPPPAPSVTGVTAAASGTARITVNWSDLSSQETAYRLQRSLDPSFATIEQSFYLLADTTSYTDRGLAEDTTYYYRVIAYNSGGDAPPGDVASAHTLATPRSPTSLTAIAATGVDSGRRVDLQWVDNASNETGFRIERSDTASFAVISNTFTADADVTSFTDTTVAPLAGYYYRVWAVNAVGDSQAAASATVTTPDLLPASSHGLIAWGVSNARIELQWDATAAPFTGTWSIERADGDGQPFHEVATPASFVLRYSDTSVVAGITYHYRIRARGSAGAGDVSDEVTARALPPQLTTLVKDINDTPVAASGSPSAVVLSGGIGYFAATGATGGRELYRTDGTSGGTFRVADLAPGAASSNPTALCDCNGTLYFYAAGAAGTGLWRSDGTEAGTTFVKSVSAQVTVPFAAVGDTLYFTAAEPAGTSAGIELWKSDGTDAGTLRVKDIRAGSASSSPANLTELGGNALLFTASDGVHGTELWRSDGTTDGTFMVRDIAPGTPGGAVVTTSIITVGATAYFAATMTAAGTELWRTDGTAAGTTMVKELAAATASSDPFDLTAFGGQLYFTANDPALGRSLFRTDGTSDGTTLIKDFTEPVAAATPLKLRAGDGHLYLVTVSSAADGKTRLYASDGTTAGTKVLSELAPGLVGGGASELVTVGDEAYVLSPSVTNGHQLWHSDGTTVGTTAIVTVPAGTEAPASLTGYEGQLLFAATDLYGRELWRSGGSAATTFRLTDVNLRTADAAPALMTPVGNAIYFSAADASNLRGLYRTDGTDGGTWRIKSANATAITGLTTAPAAPPAVIFATWDTGVGYALWRTDGNPGAGVQLTAPSSAPAVTNLYSLGGVVVYQVQASNGTYPLWRSDGTAAGTVPVAPAANAVNPAADGAAPAAAGGLFYYVVRLANGLGDELWRTDGTTAGTLRLRGATPGETLRDLRAAGNRLYFAARTATQAALWSTDGTTDGTALVKGGFANTSAGAGVKGLAWAGGAFYFGGYDTAHGMELWRSDGTADGTVMVIDANPGTLASNPSDVVDAGGNVAYFVIANGPRGRGLWRTDGTAAGTTRVKDLVLPSATKPYYMTSAAGAAYFADGGFLWKTDGTTTGTIQEMPLGDAPATPAVVAGDRLIFPAVDPSYGHELFTLAALAPAAPTNAAAEPEASGVAHVTWQDTAVNESGFLVERLVVAAGGGTHLDRQLFLSANATELTDGAVRAGVSYRYRVSAYNASGVSGAAVTADIVGTGGTAAAPAVEAITVGDGSAQRSQVMSISIRFDQAVVLGPAAITLQLLNTGGSGANDNSGPTDATAALASPTTPDGGKTWVFAFAADSAFVQKLAGVATGSLSDGIYTVSVDPMKVMANGISMRVAQTLTFHRLFGDTNGNGTVNTADYGLFRNTFGRGSGDAAYNPAFDFDGNGTINTADYGQFRGRFGRAFTY